MNCCRQGREDEVHTDFNGNIQFEAQPASGRVSRTPPAAFPFSPFREFGGARAVVQPSIAAVFLDRQSVACYFVRFTLENTLLKFLVTRNSC
jgi:hypothetical protein